jgi:hypothetical protein
VRRRECKKEATHRKGGKSVATETPLYFSLHCTVPSVVFVCLFEVCTYHNTRCVFGLHFDRWRDGFDFGVLRAWIDNIQQLQHLGVLLLLLQPELSCDCHQDHSFFGLFIDITVVLGSNRVEAEISTTWHQVLRTNNSQLAHPQRWPARLSERERERESESLWTYSQQLIGSANITSRLDECHY